MSLKQAGQLWAVRIGAEQDNGRFDNRLVSMKEQSVVLEQSGGQAWIVAGLQLQVCNPRHRSFDTQDLVDLSQHSTNVRIDWRDGSIWLQSNPGEPAHRITFDQATC